MRTLVFFVVHLDLDTKQRRKGTERRDKQHSWLCKKLDPVQGWKGKEEGVVCMGTIIKG
jgi:hypothetical protein